MRFALFFLAEYGHMVTSSAFLAVLFLGGYHLPFIPWLQPESVGVLPMLAKFLVIFTKVLLLICFMMLIRWTVPRIRYDQVLKLAWGGLIPLAIALVVATAGMVYMGWTAVWQLLPMNIALALGAMAIMPLLPKDNVNERIRIAGSRFSPLEGERVSTSPTNPTALDDSGIHSDSGGLISVH